MIIFFMSTAHFMQAFNELSVSTLFNLIETSHGLDTFKRPAWLSFLSSISIFSYVLANYLFYALFERKNPFELIFIMKLSLVGAIGISLFTNLLVFILGRIWLGLTIGFLQRACLNIHVHFLHVSQRNT